MRSSKHYFSNGSKGVEADRRNDSRTSRGSGLKSGSRVADWYPYQTKENEATRILPPQTDWKENERR
jgi:hypothetical protein